MGKVVKWRRRSGGFGSGGAEVAVQGGSGSESSGGEGDDFSGEGGSGKRWWRQLR